MSGPYGPAAQPGNESPSPSGGLEEGCACGAVVLDAAGSILTVSPAAAKMLGRQPDELHGLPLDQLPSPLADLARDALRDTSPRPPQELALALSPQESALIHVLPVRLAGGGNQPALVLVLTDRSRTRSLEADLQRLDRLANMGALAASMAHEIKNALVAVKTFTDLTLSRQPDSELGSMARRELSRIESIVAQVLRFAGPSPFKTAPVRLREVLDHSVRLAQHRMTQKAIRLERDYQAESDWVTGDEYQLEQAFVNLILNAVDAMDVGGTLTLSTRVQTADNLPAALHEGESPYHLCVTVADTGVGIPSEHLARMFEPFFTTKPGGTGLGLAITRRILEAHRAVISVESEVQRGSTFRVFFPLAARP